MKFTINESENKIICTLDDNDSENNEERIRATIDQIKYPIASINTFKLEKSSYNFDIKIRMHIIRAIAHYPSISSLDLSNHFDIGDCGYQELFKFLKDNKTLTHLDLFGNNISNEGVEALINLLEENPWIIDLDVSVDSSEQRGLIEAQQK